MNETNLTFEFIKYTEPRLKLGVSAIRHFENNFVTKKRRSGLLQPPLKFFVVGAMPHQLA